MPEETSTGEQYRNHSPLEGFDAGAQNATPVGSHSLECGSQHGLREGTGGHPDDSRDTRPDRATRFVETAFGTPSYSQLAPLLGERLYGVQVDADTTVADLATSGMPTKKVRTIHFLRRK